jgi:hypothetical protein
MKTTIALSLALIALTSAHAQIFRAEGVRRGIARGGMTENTERVQHRTHADFNRGGGYVYRHSPTAHTGSRYHGPVYSPHRYYGHRSYHSHYAYWPRSYGYFGFGFPSYGYPSYGYYSGYGYGYPYDDSYGYYGSGGAAANGLWLGALAGGIIGHNSGEFRHNGWRGAAWGAGLGWLLGSVIDANRRTAVYDSRPVVYQPAAAVQVQSAAPAQQPQQVTIINNYYNSSTPMSAANGLFGR